MSVAWKQRLGNRYWCGVNINMDVVSCFVWYCYCEGSGLNFLLFCFLPSPLRLNVSICYESQILSMV